MLAILTNNRNVHSLQFSTHTQVQRSDDMWATSRWSRLPTALFTSHVGHKRRPSSSKLWVTMKQPTETAQPRGAQEKASSSKLWVTIKQPTETAQPRDGDSVKEGNLFWQMSRSKSCGIRKSLITYWSFNQRLQLKSNKEQERKHMVQLLSSACLFTSL
jgi:hypothetical protein